MFPSCSRWLVGPACRRLLLAPHACCPPSVRGKKEDPRVIDDDESKYHDEQFHYLPMGESDVQQQCTVSFLSKDMQRDKGTIIQTISQMGFRLNDGGYMVGPIACFPKTVLSWRVSSPEQITAESLELFFLLQPKLDVLVIGVGDRKDIDQVRARVAPAIAKQRIGFEILTTEDAIATFNFLNGVDNRYVAAALYPPQDIKISTDEWAKFLHENVPESEPSLPQPARWMYAFTGWEHPVRTMVQQIWGLSDTSDHIWEALKQKREKKLEHRLERIKEKIERQKLERDMRLMAQDRKNLGLDEPEKDEEGQKGIDHQKKERITGADDEQNKKK